MKGWAPIGVVGAIVPWNFPLMLLTWKVFDLSLMFIVIAKAVSCSFCFSAAFCESEK